MDRDGTPAATMHPTPMPRTAGVPLHQPRSSLPPGAGIGLKQQHVRELLEARPAVAFLEVHAENYMTAGGASHWDLTRLRERYPLSIHGVGLSIGSAAGLDDAHLDRLTTLLNRYEPASFSEHLAWSSHDGTFFNDLLPVPFNCAFLRRICRHVDQVQSRLGRRILIENPATYVEFECSEIPEAEFLSELVRSTGCGLLLDVSNAYLSAINHGRDLDTYIDALPLDAVGEVHVAGFAEDTDDLGARLLIDTHGAPIDAAVWSLLGALLRRIGAVPVLIERDNNVPPLLELLQEAEQAARLLAACDANSVAGAG